MSIYLFPQDKANHFLYGALIGLVTLGACHAVFKGHDTAMLSWTAVLSALAVGVIKEVVDYIANKRAIARGEAPPHGVEWLDVLVTALGGAVVAVAHSL